MRRSANHLLHALKDQVRSVRYTIRAEVETPGTSLPKAVGSIELAPFIALGSVVGVPALRAVDGIFTQVESIAVDVMRPRHAAEIAYPAPLTAYFDNAVSFSDRLYDVYKRMLQGSGVRNVLLSEHAFDQAQAQFRARHGDTAARTRRDGATQAALAAGLTCALADARPIRKVEFTDAGSGSRSLMLAPNIYCAAVVGLVTALVSRDPGLESDSEGVDESVQSVVDARFDRFKRAMSGKAPIPELAAQFEALLPFLP
jgi:hypothetical protein